MENQGKRTGIPEKKKRPSMLMKVVEFYDTEDARIPHRIRVSFSDGTTAVYELHTDQPAPIIMKNLEIIQRMQVGYQYQPPKTKRRRRG